MQLQKEKVQRLVIYICSVLLMICAMTLADRQENTTWKESMPQNHVSHYICAEQPVAERAIDHLSNEQIAIPIPAASEIPGYHPNHSKPKCLHTANRLNRSNPYHVTGNGFEQHDSPIHHHVIDYYIYTLEHILI